MPLEPLEPAKSPASTPPPPREAPASGAGERAAAPPVPSPEPKPQPAPPAPEIAEEPAVPMEPLIPSSPAPASAAQSARGKVVVLDAGHGSDAGIVGVSGAVEKDITFALAQLIGERLKVATGMDVVYTRPDDNTDNLTTRRRIDIANKSNGALLVSLHTGVSANDRPHGVNIFYPYGPDGPSAGMPRTRTILGDPVTGYAAPSKAAADAIAGAIRTEGTAEVAGVRQVPLRLAQGLGMPCVLVEAGYLSNPTEESLLRSGDYQRRLADAIAAGIVGALQAQGGRP